MVHFSLISCEYLGPETTWTEEIHKIEGVTDGTDRKEEHSGEVSKMMLMVDPHSCAEGSMKSVSTRGAGREKVLR